MKALTLHQPWASLVAGGYKTVETRSWRTNYRGPLAIHAGYSLPRRLRKGDAAVKVGEFRIERDASGLLMRSDRLAWPYRLPLGAVVATCQLVDCVPILAVDDDPSPGADQWVPHVAPDFRGELRHWLSGHNSGRGWNVRDISGEAPYGDYTPGRWAWILADVQRIAPLPTTGRQGLWEWTRP